MPSNIKIVQLICTSCHDGVMHMAMLYKKCAKSQFVFKLQYSTQNICAEIMLVFEVAQKELFHVKLSAN